jgi:hypothetical protein
MKNAKSISFLLIACLVALPAAMSYAKEPRRPNFDRVFNAEKEAKISQLSNLSSDQVFERLKSMDFYVDEEFMLKAIFIAFRHRRGEAIDLALNYITLPEREINNGDSIYRTQEHYVAKNILIAFPHASINKLVELYENSDSITRGNIVKALGQMAGDQPGKMLKDALYDETVFEEEDSEMDGEPLRICDLAYNQLVLRYNINDVLRNIGYYLTIEKRNYHIDNLQDILKDMH